MTNEAYAAVSTNIFMRARTTDGRRYTVGHFTLVFARDYEDVAAFNARALTAAVRRFRAQAAGEAFEIEIEYTLDGVMQRVHREHRH